MNVQYRTWRNLLLRCWGNLYSAFRGWRLITVCRRDPWRSLAFSPKTPLTGGQTERDFWIWYQISKSRKSRPWCSSSRKWEKWKHLCDSSMKHCNINKQNYCAGDWCELGRQLKARTCPSGLTKDNKWKWIHLVSTSGARIFWEPDGGFFFFLVLN